MTSYRVSFSRGQMQIQQMAFVLVALMILFGMFALFYFSIRISGLGKEANTLREEEAMETARKLAGSPEFAFTVEDCSSCVDLDKLLILKERNSYKGFWKFDYLAVERVYPSGEGECTRQNYPNCKTITIIGKTEEFGSSEASFVSLCRHESEGYIKCELGRIYASSTNIK